MQLTYLACKVTIVFARRFHVHVCMFICKTAQEPSWKTCEVQTLALAAHKLTTICGPQAPYGPSRSCPKDPPSCIQLQRLNIIQEHCSPKPLN